MLIYSLNDSVKLSEAIDALKSAFPDSPEKNDLKRWVWCDNVWKVKKATACRLLLRIKGLPVLNPVLYGVKSCNEGVFSAYLYGYIDEPSGEDEPITKEMFADMIYRAKYVNPDPDIPKATVISGVSFNIEGYEKLETFANAQELEISMQALPKALLNDFKEKGYQLLLMPKDKYNEFWDREWGGNKNSIACYSWTQKLILSSTAAMDTIAHEFGHHLYQWHGRSGIFYPIYQKEVRGICKAANWDYADTNVREGFAEAFKLYITKKDRLKEEAPQTYEYIETLLEELKDF